MPNMGPKFSQLAKPPALEFFAGSGLAGEGYKGYFRTVWANDNCPKKAATYFANHSSVPFYQGSIIDVQGANLPPAVLSWASFPCQDLSLAGNLSGIKNSRSALVWEWLRIMDEMKESPPLLVAENVVGLLTAANGNHYRRLHAELSRRGYRTGAVVLDAKHWTPQSRPRVFVIAAKAQLKTNGLEASMPTWCHPASVVSASTGLDDFIFWHLPEPRSRRPSLESLVDFNMSCDEPERSKQLLKLVPAKHQARLKAAINGSDQAFPAYRRTRDGKQVLELRFDGLAGCLRTPGGGSSRQYLVLVRNGELKTRLLTVNETARLMGVRRTYKIEGGYNDGYKAMGDAVAVPAVRHLSRSLLAPLASRIR